VGSISKTEPYLQLMNTVFLNLLVKFIHTTVQVEGTMFVLSQFHNHR